jgi:hypothetical protein
MKLLQELTGMLAEGYTVTRGIDRERYQERTGLEGPFATKSGKVVYYDKHEGKYYDPDADMYIEYDDWKAMNEQGVAEGFREAPGIHGDEVADVVMFEINDAAAYDKVMSTHGKKVWQEVDPNTGNDVLCTHRGNYQAVADTAGHDNIEVVGGERYYK